MESKGAQHVGFVEHSPQPAESVFAESFPEGSKNLATVCSDSLPFSEQDSNVMAEMDSQQSPMANEICETLELKPAHLCRLLNSTPLGKVIDERRLYRIRMSAGYAIGSNRRVNLGKFIVWMMFNRGQFKSRSSRADKISVQSILNLLESQKYRCALTGRELTPETTALDHIVPLSRNGTHSINNAQALNKDVNRAKGTLTNSEFVNLCREVVRWADR